MQQETCLNMQKIKGRARHAATKMHQDAAKGTENEHAFMEG